MSPKTHCLSVDALKASLTVKYHQYHSASELSCKLHVVRLAWDTCSPPRSIVVVVDRLVPTQKHSVATNKLSECLIHRTHNEGPLYCIMITIGALTQADSTPPGAVHTLY